MRTLFCVLLMFMNASGSWGLVQTRTCTLFPWGTATRTVDGKPQPAAKAIGWTKEILDDSSKTFSVKIKWLGSSSEPITVSLPYMDHADSLASTLWPPSLAASILCQSPSIQGVAKGNRILELGCGLGLTGLSLADVAAHVDLTDNQDDVIDTLQGILNQRQRRGDREAEPRILAKHLEWRDSHSVLDTEKAEIVLGTDVAYYYFLLRPLMDTIQAFRNQQSSLVLVVGQANRESQWDLYHNIQNGCYNQLTDTHEPPWGGSVSMYLYQLEMETWTRDAGGGANEAKDDGTIPIAALVHITEGMHLDPITNADYIAADEDEESMTMTF